MYQTETGLQRFSLGWRHQRRSRRSGCPNGVISGVVLTFLVILKPLPGPLEIAVVEYVYSMSVCVEKRSPRENRLSAPVLTVVAPGAKPAKS